MPDVELPLSGDVTQATNPWTWMLRGSQIGMLNINPGRSSGPEFEREALDRIGSYGRQTDRMGEVPAVLVRRAGLLERDDLIHDERCAVHDFLGQVEAVAALKQRRREAARGRPVRSAA